MTFTENTSFTSLNSKRVAVTDTVLAFLIHDTFEFRYVDSLVVRGYFYLVSNQSGHTVHGAIG